MKRFLNRREAGLELAEKLDRFAGDRMLSFSASRAGESRSPTKSLVVSICRSTCSSCGSWAPQGTRSLPSAPSQAVEFGCSTRKQSTFWGSVRAPSSG